MIHFLTLYEFRIFDNIENTSIKTII